MKKSLISLRALFLSIAVFAFAIVAMAQEKKPLPSPPASASEEIGDATIKIDYHSPRVKEREIFGDEGLVPNGKLWRTGANAATTFEVGQDVKIEGKTLKAGKYALFTIPDEDEWTIIFNKVAEQNGASEYDEAQDALRVMVKPVNGQPKQENFNINIEEKGDNMAEVVLVWDTMKVPFELEVI